MPDALDLADVFGRLRRACREAGGQKAWADQCGLSPQFVNDVLAARRSPSDAMLSALGLVRVVKYVELSSSAVAGGRA